MLAQKSVENVSNDDMAESITLEESKDFAVEIINIAET